MDDDRRKLARARFRGLRNNLPDIWDEKAVSNFHDILTDIEKAFGVSLSTLRIPEERMEFVPLYSQRQPHSGRFVVQPSMSKTRRCPKQFALQQVDAVWSFLESVSDHAPPTAYSKAVALNEEQRKALRNAESRPAISGVQDCQWPVLNEDQQHRITDAEELFAANLRAHEQMREWLEPEEYRRVGIPIAPAEITDEIPKLEQDIRNVSVTILNILAEASWPPPSKEEFRTRLEAYARGISDWALGQVDKRDLPLLDVTRLSRLLADVVEQWVERARRLLPPPWTHRQRDSATPRERTADKPRTEGGADAASRDDPQTAETDDRRENPARPGIPPLVAEGDQIAPAAGECGVQSPEDRLQRFLREHLGTNLADVKYSAKVHTAEFQDWRNGRLKPTSVMFKRIEDVLSGASPLKKKPPKRRAD